LEGGPGLLHFFEGEGAQRLRRDVAQFRRLYRERHCGDFVKTFADRHEVVFRPATRASPSPSSRRPPPL
jgi:hypothetical protein